MRNPIVGSFVLAAVLGFVIASSPLPGMARDLGIDTELTAPPKGNKENLLLWLEARTSDLNMRRHELTKLLEDQTLLLNLMPVKDGEALILSETKQRVLWSATNQLNRRGIDTVMQLDREARQEIKERLLPAIDAELVEIKTRSDKLQQELSTTTEAPSGSGQDQKTQGDVTATLSGNNTSLGKEPKGISLSGTTSVTVQFTGNLLADKKSRALKIEPVTLVYTWSYGCPTGTCSTRRVTRCTLKSGSYLGDPRQPRGGIPQSKDAQPLGWGAVFSCSEERTEGKDSKTQQFEADGRTLRDGDDWLLRLYRGQAMLEYAEWRLR